MVPRVSPDGKDPADQLSKQKPDEVLVCLHNQDVPCSGALGTLDGEAPVLMVALLPVLHMSLDGRDLPPSQQPSCYLLVLCMPLLLLSALL